MAHTIAMINLLRLDKPCVGVAVGDEAAAVDDADVVAGEEDEELDAVVAFAFAELITPTAELKVPRNSPMGSELEVVACPNALEAPDIATAIETRN